MPTGCCSLLGLSLAILAAAQPLLSTHLRVSKSNSPSHSTNFFLPLNATLTGVDLLTNRGLDIECDGEKYGEFPNIADCEEARHLIPPDSDLYEFGERHTGLEGVYSLPFLLMGGININPKSSF